MDLTGTVTVDELTAYLDDAVKTMGLRELPSDYKDFEKEPFKAWKTLAIHDRLL